MVWLDLIPTIILGVLLVRNTNGSVSDDGPFTVAADNMDEELNLLLDLFISTTPMIEHQMPQTVVNRIVAVEENYVVTLKCTPNFEGDSVKWIPRMGEDKERILIANHETGAVSLTIFSVTQDDAGVYTCQKSDILEYVYVNVILPSAQFSNGSHIFIRTGGTIDLTCTTTSVIPLEEVTWTLNNTSIEPDQTMWRTKARNCFTKDKENCYIETTFGLKIENVTLSETGNYSCSMPLSKIEPASIYVQVIDQPIMIDKKNMPARWESQIIDFATEALELHGISQETAEYVREKCKTVLRERSWNCIVGEEFHAYAMSPNNFESSYAAMEFTMGHIRFSVFQSYY